jgi:hypothetical protein
MSLNERQRPPTTVVIAVVLHAVGAFFIIALAITLLIVAIATHRPHAWIPLLYSALAVLPGATAQGLWRGYRGSRNMALFMGIVSLPAGLVIVLLLTTRDAREWFAPSRRVRGRRIARP